MGIKSNGGLDRMIASLETLAASDWAKQALATAEPFMRQQLSQGLTPEGEPWPITKKGTKPLKGAADAFKIHATGRTVVMKIGGGKISRYAFHNFGAQLKPVRRQLPRGRIPGRLGDALRQGFGLQFRAITKAGKRGYGYYAKRGQNPRAA